MIELVVVIVVMGILAAAAVPLIGSVSENAKVAETKREMKAIGSAICGNPDLYGREAAAGFGYLGDIGALPPDLNALVENPGGYSTWNGPYISNSLREITDDFKTDAWQSPYLYGGGTTIISIGSGDTIKYDFASSIASLLYNKITGNIVDLDYSPPPSEYYDSFMVRVRVPDGSGNVVYRNTAVTSGGFFELDSIPVGKHTLETVYFPRNDTLIQYLTVAPNAGNDLTLRMTDNIWYDETTIVPEGLVGYWRFNQVSGTEAIDESGAGNDATLYNMDPATDWITGKAGNALDFDGNDDYLDCGDNASLELPSLSIACWVRTAQSAAYRQIVCKNRDGSGDSYYFALNNLHPSVYLGGTSNPGWYETSGTITPGIWNHIAFTYDGSSLVIYINGAVDQVVNSITGAVSGNPGRDLWIGSRDDISSREFEGTLDEVRIYNRALSGIEVNQLCSM